MRWINNVRDLLLERGIKAHLWIFNLKDSVFFKEKGEKYILHKLPKEKGYRVYVELGDFRKMSKAIDFILEDADSQ